MTKQLPKPALQLWEGWPVLYGMTAGHLVLLMCLRRKAHRGQVAFSWCPVEVMCCGDLCFCACLVQPHGVETCSVSRGQKIWLSVLAFVCMEDFSFLSYLFFLILSLRTYYTSLWTHTCLFSTDNPGALGLLFSKFQPWGTSSSDSHLPWCKSIMWLSLLVYFLGLPGTPGSPCALSVSTWESSACKVGPGLSSWPYHPSPGSWPTVTIADLFVPSPC